MPPSSVRYNTKRDSAIFGGVWTLSKSRRIAVSMPPYLLDEVDGLVARDQETRSNVIRQATAFYVQERKKQIIRDLLQQGYQEMAPMNLRLASEAFNAETEAELLAQRLARGV